MHNGGREVEIVAHLATLLRPGGHLHLIEADMPAFRFDPDDPDVADLWARWLTLMRRRGNDGCSNCLPKSDLTMQSWTSFATSL